MKNRYMLIILTSTILGIFMGMTIREQVQRNNMYINKDKSTKKEIHLANKDIKRLNNEKENIEIELDNLKNKYEKVENINKVEKLKLNLSYTDIKEIGIVIKVDALNEGIGNIANLIDYNKILVNLINEIRINGGVFISINGQRMNQYSEIVLAGSHININTVPIAQPYEIEIIGDLDKLSKYVDKENTYLRRIESNYPLKIEFKDNKNITMNRINVPNKLEYIKGE